MKLTLPIVEMFLSRLLLIGGEPIDIREHESKQVIYLTKKGARVLFSEESRPKILEAWKEMAWNQMRVDYSKETRKAVKHLWSLYDEDLD